MSAITNVSRRDFLGGVFSTGSIAWVCALSHNNYDNSISRLAGNVLRRFLDERPL